MTARPLLVIADRMLAAQPLPSRKHRLEYAAILRAADAVIQRARQFHPEVGRQIADCRYIAEALDAYEAACRQGEGENP